MVPASALCAAALVFVVTPPAGAQTWIVHVAGGLASPYDGDAARGRSSLGTLFRSGYGLRLGIERSFTPALSVVADLRKDSFPSDPACRRHPNQRSCVSSFGMSFGAEVTVDPPATAMTATVSAKLAFDRDARVVRPYAIAGAGLARVAYDFETSLRGSLPTIRRESIAYRDTAPAMSGGLGADLQLSPRLRVTVEWRYHHAYNKDRDLLGLATMGGARYWTLQLGAGLSTRARP